MRDPNMVDRRVSDARKSIPLHVPPSAYAVSGRFLVIPENLNQEFGLCNAEVDSLDGYGAWLRPLEGHQFPSDDIIMLIEFRQEWVLTHHTQVIKRQGDRILVEAASSTERERSQLAPSTGRHDYRIKVNLPVRIKSGRDAKESTSETTSSALEVAGESAPRLARLVDLSRGGMALLVPAEQQYQEGEMISIRVVSWDHAVAIDAIVSRVDTTEDATKLKLALQFPQEMNVEQRESVSTFIMQIQRREALGRALPSDQEPSTSP